jgi:hypothetical protein
VCVPGRVYIHTYIYVFQASSDAVPVLRNGPTLRRQDTDGPQKKSVLKKAVGADDEDNLMDTDDDDDLPVPKQCVKGAPSVKYMQDVAFGKGHLTAVKKLRQDRISAKFFLKEVVYNDNLMASSEFIYLILGFRGAASTAKTQVFFSFMIYELCWCHYDVLCSFRFHGIPASILNIYRLYSNETYHLIFSKNVLRIHWMVQN